MCNHCSEFEAPNIQTPEELYALVSLLQDALKSGTLIEYEKEGSGIVEQTKLNEIEKGKPWPRDTVVSYLRCAECGNEVTLYCDTYHGGGSVTVVEAG